MRNDLRRLDPAAYERAMQGLLAALDGRTGVVAAYQLGSVRFPGISDLDVIIVVDDSIPHGTDFQQIVRASAGADAAYIFSHPPYVIHEAGFPHLPSLFFADNLQHRLGRAITLAPAPAETAAFHGYQIAVEAAIAQSFAFLRSLHNRSAPNLRSLLCHLNAVRHNFATLARWSQARLPARWTRYTERIDALRGAWFELPDEARMPEAWALMAEAREILLEILGMLAALGVARQWVGSEGGRAWLSLLDVNLLLRFEPGQRASAERLANPLGALRDLPGVGPWLRMQPRWRELVSDVSVLTLPGALRPLIVGWSESRGALRDVLAARSFGPPVDLPPLPAAAQVWQAARGVLLDEYLGFVARHGLRGLLLLSPASWLQVPVSLPNRLKTRWHGAWAARRVAHG